MSTSHTFYCVPCKVESECEVQSTGMLVALREMHHVFPLIREFLRQCNGWWVESPLVMGVSDASEGWTWLYQHYDHAVRFRSEYGDLTPLVDPEIASDETSHTIKPTPTP